MENNSRGNTKVQNPMYELSYGSNTPKKRFGVKEGVIIGLLYLITINSPIYVPMILSLGLFLYYGVPKSEPKRETPPQMIYTPEYRLSQVDAICMLRNAQAKKKGL